MLRTYELMIVAKTGQSEKGEGITDSVKKLVKEHGKIVSEKDYGKRTLAYPIKKEKEADYFLITMSMDSQSLKILNEKFRRDERILRHLLISNE